MDKTEKERRNAIKRQQKNQDKKKNLRSLPISVDKLNELFDYLDEQLGKCFCDGTLKLTESFIDENEKSKDAFFSWLNENGGYCDCDIFFSMAE
ncbi:MAG: DUF2695 domain-containing protein [Pyrinomonadaceae bacterium]|nr:DUF2695 domain-containing protein [Pyrinomonadaceae bacterium]